jgi:hypothetical protein
LLLLPEDLAFLRATYPPEELPIEDFGGVAYLNLEAGCPGQGPDGWCTIYEDRPLLCRTFPFVMVALDFAGHPTSLTSKTASQVESMAWYLTCCPQCDLGDSVPQETWNDTLANCCAQFGITTVDFYRFLILFLLKDIRVADMEYNEIALRTRNRLRRAQARVRAKETVRTFTAPAYPPAPVAQLGKLIENEYRTFKQACAVLGIPVTTRELVRVVGGKAAAQVSKDIGEEVTM